MKYEDIKKLRDEEGPEGPTGGRARLLLLWLLGVPLPIILLIWLFAGNC
jgi:hypothetical protein